MACHVSAESKYTLPLYKGSSLEFLSGWPRAVSVLYWSYFLAFYPKTDILSVVSQTANSLTPIWLLIFKEETSTESPSVRRRNPVSPFAQRSCLAASQTADCLTMANWYLAPPPREGGCSTRPIFMYGVSKSIAKIHRRSRINGVGFVCSSF